MIALDYKKFIGGNTDTEPDNTDPALIVTK